MFQGLRVIDAGSYVAGPGAGTILADFGADVIKIEPPGGDPFRNLFPGKAFPWEYESRLKRSIVVDLKNAEGMDVLRRMVKNADVFITNSPLEGRKRLGIDADSLMALNPRLIYASLTAYGEVGPEAMKTGFDSTAYWSRSGLMHLVRPHLAAEPALSVVAQGDHPTALALYAAIVSALYQREKTGKGSVVKTSLLANGKFGAPGFVASLSYSNTQHFLPSALVGLYANASQLKAIFLKEEVLPRLPRHKAPIPTANMYRCADGGWITLTVLNDRQFPDLFRVLGCPELAKDPRYNTREATTANNEPLIKIFDECFIKKPRDEWRKLLDAAGITFGYIATLEDAAQDQQAKANGIILPYADDPSMLTVDNPLDLGVPKVPPTRAPKVGQHTREVLKSFGYSEAEIEQLKKKGAVDELNNGGAAKL